MKGPSCERAARAFTRRVVRARITFMAPEEYPNSLSVGQVLEISEGGHLVGHAHVTRIINKRMERTT